MKRLIPFLFSLVILLMAGTVITSAAPGDKDVGITCVIVIPTIVNIAPIEVQPGTMFVMEDTATPVVRSGVLTMKTAELQNKLYYYKEKIAREYNMKLPWSFNRLKAEPVMRC